MNLIIAGASGIGAATARLASARGWDLVVATHDREAGEILAEETGATLWVGDLTAAAAAESIVSLCLSKFARVDALFNAAGLSGRRFGDGPVHECTDPGWETALAQNLTIVFHMCRAVIARMLEQAENEDGIRGSILSLGSVFTDAPESKHFALHAYAAAKGAVLSLTRSMAACYAPQKIRVNAIAPGVVRTAASERAAGDRELIELIRRKQSLAGDMVDAEDVARAALWILSEESRFITGEILTIDAGWRFGS